MPHDDDFSEEFSPKRPLSEDFAKDFLEKTDPEPHSEATFAALLNATKMQSQAKHKEDLAAPHTKEHKKPVFKSKHKKTEPLKIDLHGKTLREAIDYLQRTLDKILYQKGYVYAKVITGRGLHSKESGAVLVEKVHDYVKSHYHQEVVFLEDSPAHSMVNGIAVRGHFHVELSLTS
ncbi:MAG: Smr/MutS family protein [Proteobacteria bacterium]|nr:Smr/MutS family protein [Pseudomonadota bacterium]